MQFILEKIEVLLEKDGWIEKVWNKRVKKNYVTKYSKSHEKNKSLIIFLIVFV
jgi:hypothetical protein